MAIEETIFVGAATVAAASAVLASTRWGRRAPGLWMGLGTLGGVLIAALMRAPVVAGLLLVLAVVWSRLPPDETDSDRGGHGGSWIAAIGVTGSVALMLVSTMARQFVDEGVDLASRPGFGEVDGFTESLVGTDPLLVMLMAVVAVVLALPRSGR